MALNAILCHQHKVLKWIKSIKNQQFMFRFHLVPLVFGEFCLQEQNSQNMARGRHLEAFHVTSMVVGHPGPLPDARWRHLGPCHIIDPQDIL
jgi:hypothetical protein